MAIHTSKTGIFGISPQHGGSINATPKRHLIGVWYTDNQNRSSMRARRDPNDEVKIKVC